MAATQWWTGDSIGPGVDDCNGGIATSFAAHLLYHHGGGATPSEVKNTTWWILGSMPPYQPMEIHHLWHEGLAFGRFL
jgi:hypothetical protein